MKDLIEFFLWVFVICMVVRYCNRENENDSIIVTTTEMVRDLTRDITHDIDSTWHAKDSIR